MSFVSTCSGSASCPTDPVNSMSRKTGANIEAMAGMFKTLTPVHYSPIVANDVPGMDCASERAGGTDGALFARRRVHRRFAR